MALDHIRPLISSFFLLLCLQIVITAPSSTCTGEVHGDRGQGLDAVGRNNLMQPNACHHSEVPSNSFKIVHRFGPCSPLKINDVIPPDNDEILHQDMLRVAYLHGRIMRSGKVSRNTSLDLQQGLVQATLPARFGASIGSYLYFIIVSMGMPRRTQTVAFDTGSSFSWIQCRPCRPCKQQRDPLFDPTLSHSYRIVSCDDLVCTQLPDDIRGCTNNTCTYNIDYIDSDSSKGIVSKERLLLPTSVVEFPNFVFGCGHQNIALDEGTAELFGLGRRFHSLVTQTSNRFGRSFSYCLPSSVAYEGYLTLGHRGDGSKTIYTPMLHNPHVDPNMYFINLTAITINNRRLQLPFHIIETGTVIDSGAAVTYLPSDLYSQVREAFRQGMARYHYQLTPPIKNLDTCYNISMPNFPYPNITLHFDRQVDLVLNFVQVFFYKDGINTYCLAFSSMGQAISVIGFTQQRGIEVIYDVEQGRFGFNRGTNCH